MRDYSSLRTEISYNKLKKLLIDRKMCMSELREAIGISPDTLTQLYRDELVSTAVLWAICDVLGVDIDDIMEFVPKEGEENG